jgi:hypothetical protein
MTPLALELGVRVMVLSLIRESGRRPFSLSFFILSLFAQLRRIATHLRHVYDSRATILEYSGKHQSHVSRLRNTVWEE